MARFRRTPKPEKDPRPVVVNDFIYDTPSADAASEGPRSETPEEAIRKLRGRGEDPAPPSAPSQEASSPETPSAESAPADAPEDPEVIPAKPNKRKVYSSGYMLPYLQSCNLFLFL